MVRFLRSDTVRHSRLGKNRPKLQKWRRPRGRHSKIRRKRFGYPVKPTIGYGTSRSTAGKIDGLVPFLVHNLHELDSAPKDSILVIARVGAKKKIDIIKKAQEKKFAILNIGETK